MNLSFKKFMVRIQTVVSDRFVLNVDLDEPFGNIHSYVGCMVQSSGELMTFSVGGPRFLKITQ